MRTVNVVSPPGSPPCSGEGVRAELLDQLHGRGKAVVGRLQASGRRPTITSPGHRGLDPLLQLETPPFSIA
jgi:hypothetical protein